MIGKSWCSDQLYSASVEIDCSLAKQHTLTFLQNKFGACPFKILKI